MVRNVSRRDDSVDVLQRGRIPFPVNPLNIPLPKSYNRTVPEFGWLKPEEKPT